MKTRLRLNPISLIHSSFTVAVTALLLGQSAQAADGTWTLLTAGSATGTWSDAATVNWSAGIVADGSGFTANFSTLNVTANSTVTLNAPRTIGNLTFGDADNTTAGSWTLAGSATNKLTLAGTTPTITVSGLNANSLTTISAIIEGTAGLTKVGTNILALSGANAYSGDTTISTGSLRAQHNTALGTGVVNVTSGARLQPSGGVNIGNIININGTSALFGNLGANILSGAVNLQSASSLSLNAANDNNLDLSGSLNLAGNILTVTTVGNTNSFITISGTINGGGGISKTGAGNLTISNNQTSSYSGNTTLTGGGLAFGSDGALGTGIYTFGVNDNTISMRSSGTASRTLGNALVLAGNAGTIHTFGSVTASVNGDLVFSNTGNIAMGSTSRRFVVNNRTEFAGAFTGTTGGIIKQTGTGTLVLSGTNTYTGATAVNAGTLLVNGSLALGSAVTINTGGTLGGTGTLGTTSVLAGGTIAPGDAGIGTLNTGAVTVAGTLAVEFNGATCDKLLSTGAVDLSGATLTVASLGSYAGPYVIAQGTSVVGTMTVPPGYAVDISSGTQAILTQTGAPANFAGWASANGVTGGVNGDSDNDGTPNGVEYSLNLNLAGSDGSPGTYSGNLLTFNKRTSTSGNSDLSYRIEVSTDLGVSVPWTEVGAYVQNSASIISATIPNGPTHNFARLRVVVNP